MESITPAIVIILKLGAVMFLIAAVELCLRGAAPRWRVFLLRGALVVTPFVIFAALMPAVVLIPNPWDAESTRSLTGPPLVTSAIEATGIEAPHGTLKVSNSPDDRSGNRVGFVLTIVWVLGASILLIREVFQLRKFSREIIDADSAPENLREIWQNVLNSFGLFPTEVIVHSGRESPFLLPGRRSRLVIPACLAQESREVLEHVFRHEAAHLRYRDPVWILSYRAFVAIFWWLPLVPWFAARHVRACEEVCDAEAAVRGGVSEYRTALAKVALSLIPMRSGATAAFLRPPGIRERLEAVFGNAGRRLPKSGELAVASLALVFVGCFAGNAVWAQKAGSIPEIVPLENLHSRAWKVELPGEKFSTTAELRAWFESEGVSFSDGAEIRYSKEENVLNVRNTEAELQRALNAVIEAGYLAPPTLPELTPEQVQERIETVLRNLPETVSALTTAQLSENVPTSYYFDYPYQPQPGRRIWRRIDSETWHEIYPDGHTTVFKVLGHARISRTRGTLVVRWPRTEREMKLKDGGLQAFIPDRGSAKMLHWYRNTERGDVKWYNLGPMKDVE